MIPIHTDWRMPELKFVVTMKCDLQIFDSRGVKLAGAVVTNSVCVM